MKKRKISLKKRNSIVLGVILILIILFISINLLNQQKIKTKGLAGLSYGCEDPLPQPCGKGCCRDESKDFCCKGVVCCPNDGTRICDGEGKYARCEYKECPADKPVKCSGNGVDICCAVGCGKHWGYPYCTTAEGNECPEGSTPCGKKDNPPVCCTADQRCEEAPLGLGICYPNVCGEGKELCWGRGDFKDVTVCCTKGQCVMNPNGYPRCLDD